MSYRRGKTQMLRDAIQCAEKGPSISTLGTDLTEKQVAEIEHRMRLFLGSWIIPAMRANLPQAKPKKADFLPERNRDL